MKTILKLAAILFTACAAAHAQVVPEATAGPAIMQYALRYSQSGVFLSGNQTSLQTNASAEVDYANGFKRFPFNLNYGGGYTWTLSGPSYATGLFQRLLISQGYIGKRWNLLASDSVYYLPQSPTMGFSGIPGTGEPIGGPGSNPSSGQQILTVNTTVVNNIATGEVGRNLNHATTLSFGGTSQVLRFPDGNGLDTNAMTANAGLTRRLDARNSLTGQYAYSRFGYGGTTFTFETNSALIDYHRAWTRHLNSDVSAGPQWVNSVGITALHSSTNISASAAVNYQLRFGSTSLSYNHQTNSGAGFLFGTTVDSANAGFTREFGKDLSIGISGSYTRNTGLLNNEVISGKFGGVQATRRLGRHLSLFANYTAMDQSSSSSSSLQPNVLDQLEQVVAFGIGYYPRATHLVSH
jgi:hypothetical protein